MNLSSALKDRSNVIYKEKLVKPSNRKNTKYSKGILQTQGPQVLSFEEDKSNTD